MDDEKLNIAHIWILSYIFDKSQIDRRTLLLNLCAITFKERIRNSKDFDDILSYLINRKLIKYTNYPSNGNYEITEEGIILLRIETYEPILKFREDKNYKLNLEKLNPNMKSLLSEILSQTGQSALPFIVNYIVSQASVFELFINKLKLIIG